MAVTIGALSWDLEKFIEQLPSPSPRYDYWPWPGVKLLNESRADFVASLSSKVDALTERTS